MLSLAALTGDGVNVVFDPISGTHIRQSYRTLRKGGRLVVYGAHSVLEDGKLKAVSGLILNSILNLIPDDRAVLTYNITRPKYSRPEWCRDDLSKLFGLLAQEKIKPVIAAQIPLIEAARAHQLLEKGAVWRMKNDQSNLARLDKTSKCGCLRNAAQRGL